MRALSFLLATLMLTLTACSITANDATPTPVQIVVTPSATVPQITPSATTAINPTPTQSTSSGAGTAPTAIAPPTLVNCNPRTDWQQYTVQSGDTLGTVAEAASSTVNALVQGNCLANPDFIAVGQVLRVPNLPSNGSTSGGTTSGGSTGSNTDGGTTTGGTTDGDGNTSGGNTAGGSATGAPQLTTPLTIRPVVDLGNQGLLTVQATIALDLGVVDDANIVRYYAGISATDTSPVTIATDDDPFDGTQVQYTFPDFDDVLFFWAVAENELGATESRRLKVTYDPDYDATANNGNSAVLPSPNIGYDTATNVYTLQYGASVTLTWNSAPTNATRIDFFVDGQMVGSDTNPTDGSAISWQVPQWILGEARARAFFPNGQTQDSLATYFYSEGEGVRPSD